MNEGPPPLSVQPRRLAGQIVGAVVAATLLTVLVALPAEYGVDPTGFGRLTGLDQVSAPLEVVIETRSDAPPEIERASEVPFRTDTVEVVLGGGTGLLSEVEYKVTMLAGDTMVYSWVSPEDVSFQFHGHLENSRPGPLTVMQYRSGSGTSGNGTLVAPINGIHGWYFRKVGAEPLAIQIHLAGYYELTPGRLEVTSRGF